MRGHIRERSPGHWAIILDITKEGARKRKWHAFKGTKREAQVERVRLIIELKTGSYVDPSKEALATFLERWLVDIKTRVSPRTYDRYAEIARKNIGRLSARCRSRTYEPNISPPPTPMRWRADAGKTAAAFLPALFCISIAY